MVFERIALWLNNSLAVCLTGRNAFFPNKPRAFHAACAAHARLSLAVQVAIFLCARHVGEAAAAVSAASAAGAGGAALAAGSVGSSAAVALNGGVAALVYLLVAEVAWQLPTHPACAMFMSNHESREVAATENGRAGLAAGTGGSGNGGAAAAASSDTAVSCQPTSSVYLGRWYDVLCLSSNYHVEHHDFPEVPLTKLSELRRRAPEFYGLGGATAAAASSAKKGGAEGGEGEHGLVILPYFAARDWGAAVKSTFQSPGFYACTGTGSQVRGLRAEP
mmetsp:Transcript_13487/g.31951  ORF Transcript_13487/g.31951 Transcript_13487/m.31951 type:complete len:277 (+) Transcript_13487:554-1384(+)